MAELSSLGRYQLKRVLGRGAMGVVYEGLDPSLNRRVAVKTILKNAAIDVDTARQYSALFAREAQAAGRLNHPNIVQVHDFAEEGEVAYLVMEYIAGRELRSFFEAKEKFEPAEAVRIMGELLDALHFAHEAGVVHRDVKPANVMLDAQRRVKLADFGVARIQDSERSAAGTMVGTPAFMSPEQIQGQKIDRRTDIFSAGTILYQLLTGEQPFTGAGAWTVAKKIVEENPPQPSSVVKSISPVFDGIVDKALAKNPANRFASASEFAATLRGALGAGPVAAAAQPAPSQRTKPPSQASDTELEFWKAIQNSTDADEFEFYLEQFPEGTYAPLARHKVAKLRETKTTEAESTLRLEAEAAAKRRQAEEQAQREVEERAKRAGEEKARQEAAEKAKREAAERAKREAEEKARQAAALARLKQQEAATAMANAKAKAAVDDDATVAMPQSRRETAPAVAPAPPAKGRSIAVPAAIGAVVIAGAIGAFLFTGRTPAPVAETAPAKSAASPAPAVPSVDADKIRRETEERVRKEFAEKAAVERAAMEKAVMEKIAAERAASERVTQAKTAAERAAAEKAVASASAERVAAQKAAAEKAATSKAAAEKVDAQRAAAEKSVMEKAAAEKAAADHAAAEKAAADKVAADKATADRLAADLAAASKSAGPTVRERHDAKLERFMQKQGRGKFFRTNQEIGPLPFQEAAYLLDGSCPLGQIKEVRGGNNFRNTPRSFSCIPLPD